MIGIIQKTLTECLLEQGGDDLRCAVFREAGIPESRVFKLDQNYPDEEAGRLLEATVTVTGLDREAVFKLFSKTFIKLLKDLFPQFMKVQDSEELIRMQAKIHALIAAGLSSAKEREKMTDKFLLEDQGPHKMNVIYRSQLQLCGLYKRLASDLAADYGDSIEINTVDCRKRGAYACKLCVRWTAIGGKPTKPVGQESPSQSMIHGRFS